MDFSQRKLSKTEWEGIEVPLPAEEKQIMELICNGYHDVNIRQNHTQTLLQFVKVQNTPALDAYLFVHYLQSHLNTLRQKYTFPLALLVDNKTTVLKKADLIRLAHTNNQIQDQGPNIFEFTLMDILKSMLSSKKRDKPEWLSHYYTLQTLLRYNIVFNLTLREKLNRIITSVMPDVNVTTMLWQAQLILERNTFLLRYADETLYDHQRQLFTHCKDPRPKLILYIAPTGTGKTMSPIGLAEKHKVIFVCAARHVGLSLARAAISLQKRVAFAFGCQDAEDIRLHFYAAKEYTKHYKSGGIGKVDNSQGEKVEIMISDVQSYLPAMLYMLAFNPAERIILYWDEPTISLDYAAHDLHDLIHRNWTGNLIPNVVLSSATLPHYVDLQETLSHFRQQFDDVQVSEIVSHDCKKTIPLINADGFIEMPHYLSADYTGCIIPMVTHCFKQQTLLRYIDLDAAVKFIKYVHEVEEASVNNPRCNLSLYFSTWEDVTMSNIKLYYLFLLRNLKADRWPILFAALQAKRKARYASSIHIVTKDAFTLTDGPTIFLADDVAKVAQFYFQSAQIPAHIVSDIQRTIQFNTNLNSQATSLEKDLEDGKGKGNSGMEGKEKKNNNEERLDPEMKRLMRSIEELRAQVKMVSLNPAYVPNTHEHLLKHAPVDNIASSLHTKNAAFTSDISEYVVEQIMRIDDDIEDSWKLLLLMGIGVFAAHKSARYTEIMKQLAQEQKLYLVIASSDYIYGTNYQFCHGYIGKDLNAMSQEKAIQAMGRVGRNNIQQDYSVRFRSNELLLKLFLPDAEKPEVANMNRLFNA
jgi:hypothetical protein